MASLNPTIAEMSVGVRELRKVKVYPLAVADQLAVKSLCINVMGLFDKKRSPVTPEQLRDLADLSEMDKLKAEEAEEAASMKEGVDFVTDIISILQESMEQIVGFVTDEKDNVSLNDMTNEQLTDLLDIVATVNFETPGKKLKTVITKVKGLFPLKK